MRKSTRCVAQKGFTLVEVLVALAITGMLVSVLMSSLFYIFRVQEGVREETLLRERQLRERAWFRAALAGCLPEEENERRFQGDRAELQCQSANALLPEALPATARIRMALVQEGDGIRLRYEESGGKTQATLASWEGVGAEFRFIDAKGEEKERWLPQGNETLPRQIWLVLTPTGWGGVERREVWLAAVGADPWLPEKPALPPGMTWDMFKR